MNFEGRRYLGTRAQGYQQPVRPSKSTAMAMRTELDLTNLTGLPRCQLKWPIFRQVGRGLGAVMRPGSELVQRQSVPSSNTTYSVVRLIIRGDNAPYR